MTMARSAAAQKQTHFSLPYKEKWMPVLTRLLLIAVLVFVVWSIWQWVQDPASLPLKNINVEGDLARLQKSDLQQVMQPYTHRGFFTLDVNSLQEKLEQLPWVERATVRRIWRDTLNVHVTEQRAVAYWGADAFLNQSGDVFTPIEKVEAQSLPVLHGPDGHEAQVLQLYKTMNLMLESIGQAVQALDMDARRAWHLQLTNSISIELGRINMRARLQRFIQAYPVVLAYAAERIESIDLRYSNGFSVRWKLENSHGQAS
ncbi:MAG: cell division protein FtsQ/DivIB [Gammaproteobacteria bacterium]